jgi:ABC-type spermidine/putrescine transport system permease subunit II
LKRLAANFAAVAGRLCGATALTLLILPLVYAAWISFSPGELLEPPTGDWSLRWYRAFVNTPAWTRGLLNSLLIATMSATGATLTAAGAALSLTRVRFRGCRWLPAFLLLPLFVPHVVLGMGLLPVMQTAGLWGTRLSLALAHSLVGLPVAFLILRSALEQIDPELEQAARGLGAGPAATFVRVALPLWLPALALAGLVTFILSLNEFPIALFLCTPDTETLPKVIWPNLRYTLSPLAAAGASVTVLITAAALAAGAALTRGKHRTAR